MTMSFLPIGPLNEPWDAPQNQNDLYSKGPKQTLRPSLEFGPTPRS